MKNKLNFGFTLIEMLVSMAIIITTTTVVVSILASSFTGVTKSTVSEEVRQNGTSALTRISRSIQFAEGFEGVSETGEADSYITSCSDTVSGLYYKYVKIKSGGATRMISCTDEDIAIDTVTYLDKSRVQVIPDSCQITCVRKDDSTPPVIGVSFGLTRLGAPDSNKTKSNYFSTSIKMRNL